MQSSASFDSWKGVRQLVWLRQQFTLEMKGRIARASVNTFMEEFVPGTDLPEDHEVVALDNAKLSGKEVHIYGELVCSLVNAVCF